MFICIATGCVNWLLSVSRSVHVPALTSSVVVRRFCVGAIDEECKLHMTYEHCWFWLMFAIMNCQMFAVHGQFCCVVGWSMQWSSQCQFSMNSGFPYVEFDGSTCAEGQLSSSELQMQRHMRYARCDFWPPGHWHDFDSSIQRLIRWEWGNVGPAWFWFIENVETQYWLTGVWGNAVLAPGCIKDTPYWCPGVLGNAVLAPGIDRKRNSVRKRSIGFRGCYDTQYWFPRVLGNAVLAPGLVRKRSIGARECPETQYWFFWLLGKAVLVPGSVRKHNNGFLDCEETQNWLPSVMKRRVRCWDDPPLPLRFDTKSGVAIVRLIV